MKITVGTLGKVWFDVTHPSLTMVKMYVNLFRDKYYTRLTNKVDYSTEAFFWEQWYYQHSVFGKHPDWRWDENLTKGRYSKKTRQILEILLKDFNEKLKLIDVGSGPVTSFFDLIDITAWEIVTVDPLAKLYNHLNKKYGINYSLKCTEGTGECLDKLFNQSSFHLVLSQNAIDHSNHPLKFIKNLYYVLKPGGFMCLVGFVKEGTRTNWTGLHQHDLYVVGDSLYWMNRDKSINGLNITKDLDMTLFHKYVKGSNPGDWFTLIYRKT